MSYDLQVSRQNPVTIQPNIPYTYKYLINNTKSKYFFTIIYITLYLNHITHSTMEQKFIYNNLPVRTLTDGEDQTWFAGVDVCNLLEYADTTQAIEKLDEDERRLDRVRDGSGQQRKAWMVNESGLYSLIITSTKPEAKAFKRWITHEVLPAIRKAGKYTSEEEKSHELQLQALANAIQSLRDEKEEYQRKVNDIKKDIENKTAEMIALIQADRSQLLLPFPA